LSAFSVVADRYKAFLRIVPRIFEAAVDGEERKYMHTFAVF